MTVHCEITIVLRIIIACRDIVVSMNLHGRACEVGTRRDMRTLKPGSWLFDTVSVGCAHMNLHFSFEELRTLSNQLALCLTYNVPANQLGGGAID